jgi:DNA-binding NtrC family response regulator
VPVTESASTVDIQSSVLEREDLAQIGVPALMIAWCAEEPHRIGEVALFEMEGAAQILGRGEPSGESAAGRVAWGRQRPGETQRMEALKSAGLSREQLRITASAGCLRVERIGRCSMFFQGEKVDRCVLSPGDTLLLKGQLLLLCTERHRILPALQNFPLSEARDFGEPDALGILGESAEVWRLRDAIAFHAKAGAHTLILGPSGAGKELAARAVHSMSPRARGPFIARNAATLPPGLVDAELFGNARNYPNPGMPERPGLVGAADGGTLFLDEIGELPSSLHANLLRVLDGDGEYHRLGEAKPRRASLRLVAATNRAPDALKHDLLARLPLRLTVPGLDERREDIPLLLRALLRRALANTPDLVERFAPTCGEPRVSADLVDHLLHRPYTTHIRELEGCLWRAMAGSRGSQVGLSEEMALEPRQTTPPPRDSSVEAAPALPTQPPAPGEPVSEDPEAARLRACIAEHDGNLVKVARALGLPSRYALYRLLRKHGIDVRALRGEGK